MCYYGWITKDWREYLREGAFHITRVGEQNIPCAQDQRACLHDYMAHLQRPHTKHARLALIQQVPVVAGPSRGTTSRGRCVVAAAEWT
jgi:hypothetical protein